MIPYKNKDDITTEDLQTLIQELIDQAEPALVMGFHELEELLIQHMDLLDEDSLHNILLLFAALNMRPQKKIFLLWQRAMAKKLDKLPQHKIDELALLLAAMNLNPQRSFLRALQQRLHARTRMMSRLQQLKLLWAQTKLGMISRTKAQGLFRDQEKARGKGGADSAKDLKDTKDAQEKQASRKEDGHGKKLEHDPHTKERGSILSQEALFRAVLGIPFGNSQIAEINSYIKNNSFSPRDKVLLVSANHNFTTPFIQNTTALALSREAQGSSATKESSGVLGGAEPINIHNLGYHQNSTKFPNLSLNQLLSAAIIGAAVGAKLMVDAAAKSALPISSMEPKSSAASTAKSQDARAQDGIGAPSTPYRKLDEAYSEAARGTGLGVVNIDSKSIVNKVAGDLGISESAKSAAVKSVLEIVRPSSQVCGAGLSSSPSPPVQGATLPSKS